MIVDKIISAGTTFAGENFVFSNSNNVSFGISGQTITASFSATGTGGGGVAVSAGANSISTGTIVFSNSNGITFGLSNDGMLTASHNGLTSQSNQVVSAANGSFTFQTLTFANSNGVTFNTGTQGLFASVKTDYLTTAMQSDEGSRFVNTNAGLNLTNISATFNSNSISLSVANTVAQSNQTLGLYVTGNSTQNSSTILDARSISFNAIGSITMGYSNGSIQVSAPNALTTAMASDRGTDFVQATAIFAGTNAIGTIASDGISVSVDAQSIQPVAVSASNGSFNFSTLKFVESNGVTWATSTDGIRASVKTDYLTTAMVSDAGSRFVNTSAGLNLTNVSATLSSNSISISVAAQSVQPVAASASNGSFNFSTIKFVETNGVTWITSTDGIRASVKTDYLTTAMASNRGSDFMGTNTAITQNGVSMTANSSGLSLNFPAFLTTAALSNHSHAFATTTTNGSVINIATSNSAGITIAVPAYLTTALTTARASNDAIGLNTALTANGVSWTVNSSGLSLNVPAFLTTAMASNASTNFAGIGSAITNGTMTFGTGGLSLNLSNHLTTARASTDGIGLNTAQSNVTWTVNSSGLSLDARGYAGTNTATTGNISITLNSSGISLNAPAFLTTADLSQNSSRYIQNWKITGNTSGTTSSAQGTDLWLAGGNGVTISGNSNSLSFSVATNYQSQGAYLTTAMASNASTQFVQANAGFAGTNASGTIASSGISISVNAGGGVAIKGSGAQSQSTGTVEFANSNGITFGLSNNGTMTASHNGLTTAMASNRGSDFMGTNTALTANGVSMTANSSGLSLNFPAFLTTAMQSNAATISNVNISGGTTSSNLSNFKFIDSNGVSWSLDTGSKIYATVKTDYQTSGNYLTTAMASNRGSDFVQATAVFNGTNASGTIASNAISISVAAQTNQTLGGYASGNTVGQSSSSTFDARSFSISAVGNMSAGYSNGMLYLSGGTAAAAPVNVSAGTTSGALSQIIFSNSNLVSFGLNGSTITGSVPGTSSLSATGHLSISVNGATISIGAPSPAISGSNGSFSYSTATFGNLNGLSFYTSNGSMVGSYTVPTVNNTSAVGLNSAQSNVTWTVNSSGISLDARGYAGTATSATNASITLNSNGLAISVAAPGGANYTALSVQNRQLGASSTIAPGQSWLWLSPVRIIAPVSASTMFGMLSLSGTITSAATAQFGASLYFGIWSQHSTDANRFDTYWTGGRSFTAWNSGTSSYSYAYDTYNGNSAGSNLGTASVMGLRQIKMDIGSIIPSGIYIFGSMMITSSAGYSAAMSRAVAVFDNPLPTGMGVIGSATNTSNGYVDGGRWSAQTAALPNTISIGHIIQSSNVMPYFKIGAI